MLGCKIKAHASFNNPITSLMQVWYQSRPSTHDQLYKDACVSRTEPLTLANTEKLMFVAGIDKVNADVIDILQTNIPVADVIQVVITFTGMPISLREQFVREPVWKFWLQSFREGSAEDFFSTDMFYVPQHVGQDAKNVYASTMSDIETAYNVLLDCGVPPEKARGILPMHMTHNGTAFVGLRRMYETFNKRMCWIAQSEYWLPFISQVVASIRSYNPVLALGLNPPCFNRDQWCNCSYKAINENRFKGEDKYAPCPIWHTSNISGGDPSIENSVQMDMAYGKFLQKMNDNNQKTFSILARDLLPIFEKVWDRNVITGSKLRHLEGN